MLFPPLATSAPVYSTSAQVLDTQVLTAQRGIGLCVNLSATAGYQGRSLLAREPRGHKERAGSEGSWGRTAGDLL